MNDLPEFLLARFAEDEEVARASHGIGDGDRHLRRAWPEGILAGRARVLAECDAKHEIASRLRAMEAGVLTRGGLDVAISELRQVCQFLALPYADHPDYREEWKPS